MRDPLKRSKPVLVAIALASTSAWAEVGDIRVASGPSIGYLPYYVMEHHKLFEKHARAAGLGEVKAGFVQLTGGAAMNDALLAGALEFSSVAVPAFLTLWSRTRGTRQEVKAAAALNSQPVFMNTNNPAVRSVRDLTPKDRIAVTAVKVSVHAIIVQMAAAQAFGEANFAQLDALTVALPHPAARDALLSRSAGITVHMATEPFAAQEARAPGIHTVLSSYDVTGGPSTISLVVTTSSFRAANPKTYAAFMAALNESVQIIGNDRKAAAEIFIKATKSKASTAEILESLEDRKNPITFGTTPLHVMRFADFMFKAKSIPIRPASWTELFFPEVHALPGS
jgi:NitT/TauT family transport system substrate-binding protein